MNSFWFRILTVGGLESRGVTARCSCRPSDTVQHRRTLMPYTHTHQLRCLRPGTPLPSPHTLTHSQATQLGARLPNTHPPTRTSTRTRTHIHTVRCLGPGPRIHASTHPSIHPPRHARYAAGAWTPYLHTRYAGGGWLAYFSIRAGKPARTEAHESPTSRFARLCSGAQM